MTWTAVGSILNTTSTSLTVAQHTIGNLILVEVIAESNTVYPTSISGGNCTWTQVGVKFLGTANAYYVAVFAGTATATGSATATLSFSGTTPTIRCAGWEFNSSVGSWTFDAQGKTDSSSTVNMASITAAGSGELYFGYVYNSSNNWTTAGSTPGYSYHQDANSNSLAYNLSCGPGATSPTWAGTADSVTGIYVLMTEAAPTPLPGIPLESAWPGYPAPAAFVPGLLIEYSHGTQYTETLVGTVATTGTISRKAGKLLAAPAAVTVTMSRSIARSLMMVLVFTGSLIRQVKRSVSTQLIAAASIIASRLKYLTVIASAATTAQLPRTMGRILAGQAAVTGALGRSIYRTVNAAAAATSTVARIIRRSLNAPVAIVARTKYRIQIKLTALLAGTATVGRKITRTFVTLVTAVAKATVRSGPVISGILQIVLPGSGVTSGAFNIVIPAIKGVLSGAFSIFKYPTLPGPVVSLTGKVWYGLITVVLPKVGVTLTGKNYHSVVTVDLPVLEVNLTGTVIGNIEGSIYIDLSHRSMGTRFFEERLTPARWKLGAPKRQWKTHLTYTQEILGQLEVEWGTGDDV